MPEQREKRFVHPLVRSFNEKERTAEFVISTYAKDRHGTVLNQDNWSLENYQRNPIIGYQHNVYGDDICSEPNPDMVIGHSELMLENLNDATQLAARAFFEPADINPLAEKIFKKIAFGTLRMASVGFLPVGKGREVENEETGEKAYHYEGQELLEWSVVNIPSNPEAAARHIRDMRAAVLLNIKRYMGSSYADIENMTVGEVLGSMDNRLSESKLEDNKKIFKGMRPDKRIREMQLFNII